MASASKNLSTGARHSGGPTPISPRRRTSHHGQTYTFVNYQAAVMDVTKNRNSQSLSESGSNGVEASPSHPTMRLSHIQHNASSSIDTRQSEIDMTSAKKFKYHEAVSQNMKKNFDAELARSFATPSQSRDEAQPAQAQRRKVSLPASHPATYGNSVAPYTPASMPSGKVVSFSPDLRSLSALSNSSMQPPDLPWRKATADPTWQTSLAPPYWTRNRTVLKADANVEHGNVVSPTWMIGLPFGCGMTEVADVYPILEDSDV